MPASNPMDSSDGSSEHLEEPMIQDAPSERPPRSDRYKVRRPLRQRIAGWCALSSVALLLCLIVIIEGGEDGKGLRGVAQWFPGGTIYVTGFLGILFVASVVSAVYWAHAESASNGFPRRREHGDDGGPIDHSRWS